MKTTKKSGRDVVKLTDLAPVRTVKGGSGRLVFGTDSVPKSKDMTPRKNPKGGANSIKNR